VAVGVTDVQSDSPEERSREIRVAQILAQREAVEFIESNEVVVHDQYDQTTVVSNQVDARSAKVSTKIDEETFLKVKGALNGLSEIGTWKSEDGTLFFSALARKLD
jgi:uncharacterized protein YjiK